MKMLDAFLQRLTAKTGETSPWLEGSDPIKPSDLDGSFKISDRKGYENIKLRMMRTTSSINDRGVKPRGILVFTTDDKRFHLHDGITPGGCLHWALVNTQVFGSAAWGTTSPQEDP